MGNVMNKLRFATAEDEDNWIDDNGDHHLASYDGNGLAYYTDRSNILLGEVKSRAPRRKVSDKTKTIRDDIRKFGYQHLTGSMKQKEWAEKIRKDVVDSLPDDYKSSFTEKVFHRSKFWIENRHRSALDFVAFCDKSVELLKIQLDTIDGNWETFQKARNERNELFEEWCV